VQLRRKPMIGSETNAAHRMYLPYRTTFRLSRTGKDAPFHKLRRCSRVSELCTHKIRPFRRCICSKGQSEVKCKVLPAWDFAPSRGSQAYPVREERPAFSEQTGKAKKKTSSGPYVSCQHSVMRLQEGVGVTQLKGLPVDLNAQSKNRCCWTQKLHLTDLLLPTQQCVLRAAGIN
jgi:hypothetical protein